MIEVHSKIISSPTLGCMIYNHTDQAGHNYFWIFPQKHSAYKRNY